MKKLSNQWFNPPSSIVYIDEYSNVHYLPEDFQFDNSETTISVGKKGANLKKLRKDDFTTKKNDNSGEVHFSNKFKVVPVI